MTEVEKHIHEKIEYHEELLMKFEADEDYRNCIIHRDEINRLKGMLPKPKATISNE